MHMYFHVYIQGETMHIQYMPTARVHTCTCTPYRATCTYHIHKCIPHPHAYVQCHLHLFPLPLPPPLQTDQLTTAILPPPPSLQTDRLTTAILRGQVGKRPACPPSPLPLPPHCKLTGLLLPFSGGRSGRGLPGVVVDSCSDMTQLHHHCSLA